VPAGDLFIEKRFGQIGGYPSLCHSNRHPSAACRVRPSDVGKTRNVQVGAYRLAPSRPSKKPQACATGAFTPVCGGAQLGISSAAEGSMTEAKFEGIGLWILLMLLLISPWLLE
jgi:hypothetical protein